VKCTGSFIPAALGCELQVSPPPTHGRLDGQQRAVEESSSGVNSSMDRDPVRILLVEDTEAHVGLIRHALRSSPLPIDLSFAETLQEARMQLAQSTPDVMILDLQLPDGRGMDLFPSDGTQLPFPIIVTTAHGEQRVAVEAMKAGAMDYVVKSHATLAEMPLVVKRTLQQWRHIAERQRAEAALRESEQRYRDIANHIPGVVFQALLHADGSLQLPFVSERVADFLGIPAHELQQNGSLLLDMLTAEEYEATVDAIRMSADGRTSFAREFELKTRPGNAIWVRVAASIRTLPSGTILLDGVAVDVSEQKQIAESLQRAHDELETRVRQRTAELTAVNQRLREEIEGRNRVEQQAQQRLAELAHVGRLNTMGGMIAELAHEINQPLFAITNYAAACQELLSARGNGDLGSIPQWLDKISRQACRTGEIIRRLNRFIRQTQPQQSTASINDLVANVVELMESRARLYRVEIQLEFGRSLPRLLMDRIQIEQVIANLVQNAIDAMREMPTEQRRLTVQTSVTESNEIRVAVCDAGIGITQEDLDRVFDAFYTTKEDGMGMGLAICRSIVEDHDGQLQATHNPDHGTTFSFTLPVRTQQESEYVREDDGVCRG